MNKEFKYKSYNFNIKVELNYKNERKIGGRSFHRITINDLGYGNFYKVIDVEDSDLVVSIEKLEILAKEYIDRLLKKGKSENESKLIEIGFK